MYLKDLESYKCPVIITQSINNKDKAIAVISLFKTLSENEKKVELIILEKLSKEYADLLTENAIKHADNVKPLLYEVWVDYGKTSIKSITYDIDEKDKKLKFIITPGEEGFDFSSVEFKDGGSLYDLTILFDIEKPEELGSIYENNDYIFRENKVISIGATHSSLIENTITITEDNNYTQSVYKLLEKSKVVISKDIQNLLLNTTIENIDIFNEPVSSNTWSVISSLSKKGVDINSVIRKKYFSKSQENLNMYIKMMQNVKMNNQMRYIWSYIENSDLKYFRITKNNLDISGRLPFNISKEFDIAFGCYEISPKTILMVIESNDVEKFTASSFASIFHGEGNDNRAVCTIKNISVSELESKIIDLVNEIDMLNKK